jgi:excisionase family DNA binding protein
MPKPTKTPPTPDRLLTIQEVADHCQVATKTVRRWIDGKELAAFKLGRQWRISERDLKHFLRERWNG